MTRWRSPRCLSGYGIDMAWYGLHHVLAQTLVREAGAGHGQANAVLLPPHDPRAGTPGLGGVAETELAERLATLASAARLGDLGIELSDETLDRCAAAAAARLELATPRRPPTRTRYGPSIRPPPDPPIGHPRNWGTPEMGRTVMDIRASEVGRQESPGYVGRRMKQPVTVLCADDHPLYLSSVVRALREDTGIEIVGEVPNGRVTPLRRSPSCGPTSPSSTCRCRG